MSAGNRLFPDIRIPAHAGNMGGVCKVRLCEGHIREPVCRPEQSEVHCDVRKAGDAGAEHHPLQCGIHRHQHDYADFDSAAVQ